MSIKPGYIEVFVFDNGTGNIVNSNGFNYQDLTQMIGQMEEQEQFEGMESFIYCFKPEYCTPQEDHMGRIEVPGYWEFKEDNYTKEKNKKYRKEFEEFKEWEEGNEPKRKANGRSSAVIRIEDRSDHRGVREEGGENGKENL